MNKMLLNKIIKSKIFIVVCTLFCFGFILAQTIKNPEFKKINTFEVHSFENGVFKASINLGIYNSNWFSIKGKEIDFEMVYKNHLIAKGSSYEPVTFHRKTISELPVELDFYPDSLNNDLKEILLTDSLLIEVHLSGKFTFFGFKSTKTFSTWLKTEDLVKSLVAQSMGKDGLKLKKVKLLKVELQKSVFKVDFNLKNTLDVPIELKNFHYSIYADKNQGNIVADWDNSINKEIKTNQVELIEGEVVVNNLTSALSGLTKILNGKIDYYLSGYALIALKGREIKIPIEQHLLVNPLTQKITIIEDYE